MKHGAPFASIDEYLASVPAGERAALEKIRQAVHSAAPDAAEAISYGMPAFRQNGLLVGFAAFKNHCSFFPMSSKVMQECAGGLTGYSTAKGTIRFTAEKPLPTALVKRIVKARIAENEARTPKKTRRGVHEN